MRGVFPLLPQTSPSPWERRLRSEHAFFQGAAKGKKPDNEAGRGDRGW